VGANVELTDVSIANILPAGNCDKYGLVSAGDIKMANKTIKVRFLILTFY
jgi:hypothetical protein